MPNLTEREIVALKEAQHKGWMLGYTEAWNNAKNGDLPSRPPLDPMGNPWKNEVDEPTRFGSLVRAGTQDLNAILWTLTPASGGHYWQSQFGDIEVWSELTDVEVLRNGLGVADEEKLEASFRDGLHEGMREMNARIHARLVSLHDVEVLKLRQRGLEKAMQAVEELAP